MNKLLSGLSVVLCLGLAVGAQADTGTAGHPTGNLGNRFLTHPDAADVYADTDKPLKTEKQGTLDHVPDHDPGKVYISGGRAGELKEAAKDISPDIDDPGVLISRPPEAFTAQEEAREFPNRERRSNQEIAADEPARDKTPAQAFPRDFANRNRPETREIMRQRKEQTRDLTGNLSEGEVLVTVAGFHPDEVAPFGEILKREYGQVKALRVVEMPSGLAAYAVALEGNLKEFAGRLEVGTFGPFALEQIKLGPKQANFVLEF